MWTVPEVKSISRTTRVDDEMLKFVSGCDPSNVSISYPNKEVYTI